MKRVIHCFDLVLVFLLFLPFVFHSVGIAAFYYMA